MRRSRSRRKRTRRKRTDLCKNTKQHTTLKAERTLRGDAKKENVSHGWKYT